MVFEYRKQRKEELTQTEEIVQLFKTLDMQREYNHDKSKIYSEIVKRTGYPKPTVRRAVNQFINGKWKPNNYGKRI